MKSNLKKIVIIVMLGMIFAISFISNYNFIDYQNKNEITVEIRDETNTNNLKISGYWPTCPRIHIKNDNWSAIDLDWIQNSTGTYDEPHIIENVTINAGGIGCGILIENSVDYFIIKNSSISNVGHSEAAIKLVNVRNGRLLNNTFSDTSYGIYLNKSVNNIICDNIVNNLGHGIHLIESNDTIISNNNVNYNSYGGIRVESCNNITITENSLLNDGSTRGNIRVEYSHSNIITKNQISYINVDAMILHHCDNNEISENIINRVGWNFGIRIDFGDNNLIIRNNINDTRDGINLSYCTNSTILENNSTNGKKNGIYMSGGSNKAISNILRDCGGEHYSTGGIQVRHDENTILNNTILNSNNGSGIYVSGDYNFISQNDIVTSKYGIYLDYSENNDMYQNLINHSSENGVFMEESDNNTLQANDIINNGMNGVAIDNLSDWNLVYNNKFLENGLNAIDNGSNNRWDNGLIGNYWDNYGNIDEDYDGIGEVPYNISGTAGSKDNFPLGYFAPLIVINLPFENQEFRELAPAFHISVDETYLVSTWYTLNDGVTPTYLTGLFGYIDQDIWNNITNGPVKITFYAKDIFDNERSEEVNIIKNVTVPEPCEVIKLLQVEITENSFSTKHFNFTFFVVNELEQEIDSAKIQMWWNGINVSNDVQNLGDGLYFVSLEPITVESGEDPILLSMNISVAGYEDKHFETYLAVDPETLKKEVGQGGAESPFLILIIAIISTVGVIGAIIITGGILRKRKLTKEIF